MARALRPAEAAPALRELLQEITELDPAVPALRRVVPAVKALTGSAQLLAYGMEFVGGESGLDVPFAFSAGFPHSDEVTRLGLLENARRVHGPWGLFDPFRPEPAQRNRPTALKPLRELVEEGDLRRRVVESLNPNRPEEVGRRLAEGALPLFERYRIDRSAQLRILVCDGERLLCWLGGYRDAPYGTAEQTLLSELAAVLIPRLKLEERLEGGALSSLGVAALLERVAGPAVIVRKNGHVVHANAAAEPLLERAGEYRAVSAALREALQGTPSPAWELVRLQPSLFLALARPQEGADPRVQEAAREWGLTRRQSEVLTLLCRGLSNKAIASELRCALSTVEIHVSAILVRADKGSRAEIIAAISRRR